MSNNLVKYYDERHGFWRYGHVTKMGHKWARVLPVMGKSVKVPVTDVKPVEPAEIK